MNTQDIIKEITATVVPTSFSAWRIGLTHEPQERKRHWKNVEEKDVSCWTTWRADSLTDAKDVEDYFVGVRGMKSVTNGEDWTLSNTGYVYIF
jgi:hypothetical protein